MEGAALWLSSRGVCEATRRLSGAVETLISSSGEAFVDPLWCCPGLKVQAPEEEGEGVETWKEEPESALIVASLLHSGHWDIGRPGLITASLKGVQTLRPATGLRTRDPPTDVPTVCTERFVLILYLEGACGRKLPFAPLGTLTQHCLFKPDKLGCLANIKNS